MIKVTGSMPLTNGIRIQEAPKHRDPDPQHWLAVPELVADLAEQLIVVIRGALLALSPDPDSDPDPQHSARCT
jgi:hypothetical protein